MALLLPPKHSHRKATFASLGTELLEGPTTLKELLQHSFNYEHTALERTLRLPSSSDTLEYFTPDMDLGTSSNEEPGHIDHGNQSFINDPRSIVRSAIGIHPPAAAPHDYSRDFRIGEVQMRPLSAANDGITTRGQDIFSSQVYGHPQTAITGDAAIYYSDDANAQNIWAQQMSLHDQNRGIYLDARADETTSTFSSHHQYRSNKFSETSPLFSAYNNLNNSIDSITSERPRLSNAQQQVRQGMRRLRDQRRESRILSSDAAHISSRSAALLPPLSIPNAEYDPSTAGPELSRSSYSFDSLDYRMQGTTQACETSFQKGKRKISLEKQGALAQMGSQTQKRNSVPHDKLEGGFEAIMDEAYPFEGCFVLAPTSVEGRKHPSAMSPKRRGSKQKGPRKPMGLEDREAVKHNRINGVCVRCKMFKEKCRGGFPCQRCCELRIWKTICVTSQLIEKQVFSRGLYRALVTQLSKNVIRNWKAETPATGRIIQVSNGYAPILQLEVHEFEPQSRDLLEHIVWHDVRRSSFTRLPSTPYGLREEQKQVPDYDRYIDAHIPVLVQEMEEKLGETSIYTQTIKAAQQCEEKKDNLLRLAFRIWVINILLFKRPWRISPTSTDNLGMSAISNSSSLLGGITPLPRLLHQQLDNILECRAAELEHQLLSEVQNMIFRRLPGEWFITFLTIFVFLSAVEKDTWNLETWNVEASSQKCSESQDKLYWPLQDISPSILIEKNMLLVDIMSAHFRSVTRGNIPFTLNWRSDLGKQMAAYPDAITYMQTVGEQISNSSSILKRRRASTYCQEDEYSLDMKFSSKLMVNDDNENE